MSSPSIPDRPGPLNENALEVAIEIALFHALDRLEPWGEGCRVTGHFEKRRGTRAQNAWRRGMAAHVADRVATVYAQLVDPDSLLRLKSRRPDARYRAGAPSVGDI